MRHGHEMESRKGVTRWSAVSPRQKPGGGISDRRGLGRA